MTSGDFSFAPELNSYYDASFNLQRLIENRTISKLSWWDDRRREIADEFALKQAQERVRSAVVRGIGGAIESDSPVRWESRGELNGSGFTVERMIYQSSDRVAVPALLYRPASVSTDASERPLRRGAVFVACGHLPDAKAASQYQRLSQSLARAGLVVLIADPIGQGERSSYLSSDGPAIEPGVVEHTYVGVQCWWNGESSARYFLRDASAGISFLAALPDVDADRIGVTGDSGGGTLTTLLMALEPRIAAAVPVTYLTSRASYICSGQPQDAEQILLGGTTSGVDHADLLMSMSPRPVLVLAAEYDFFPIDGTIASVTEANRVLRACGRPAVGFRSWPVMHEYTPKMIAEATCFLAKALGLEGKAHVDEDDSWFVPFPASDLQVTDSGQILNDFPDSDTIFTSTSARIAKAVKPSPEEAIDWLRVQVVERREFSEQSFPRWFPPMLQGGLHIRQGYWFTESGVLVAGVHVFVPGASDRAVTISLRPEGTVGLSPDDRLLDRITEDNDLLILDTRGAGALTPHERGGLAATDMFAASYKLGCDLLWLGDSLGAGRVYDTLRTVELCRDGLLPGNLRPARVALHSTGLDSLTALSAALLDEGVASVEILNFDGQEAVFDVRDYDISSAPWRQVIPGFAQHFDTDLIVKMLGSRLDWETRTAFTT